MRQGLWRRLQDRLRLWWLRWVWMRRMRSWLVGSLRHWVRRRCRMLYILGRLSLLLAMAHHERAIRLLADHLGFSSWGFTLALLPLGTLHERRLDLDFHLLSE